MADKPYRKLYRSRDNAWLGGVCGGIGEYFNIDPLIIRLLFILFASGGGLYFILWLIIPKAPLEDEPSGDRRNDDDWSDF
ncbi:PspC domain-containing protein [Lacticaseibacillus sp. GG6-2]